MFTDIEGYTTLTQSNESSALKLLSRERELIRPVISRFAGREVKTMGDGSLIEFRSALEASECAVEMLKVLHDFNQSAKPRILLRVGIHVGDVVLSEGDVYGDAVNIASRIEPLASGGGICISEEVYRQVRNKMPYHFLKLESNSLRNISFPIDVYRLELPWEAAPSSDVKLDRRRVAVLPFDNISPDPNDEYFSDGLTEELITVLSRVEGLEVIARTSVLRYKGGTKQVSAIGNELRVGAILEGSVRKAGDRIRVTAQLIDAVSQAHVWSGTYDRRMDDIFAVQSEIAGNVANALRLELTTHETSKVRRAKNLEAYTMYLKGRFASNKLDKETLLKAIEYYEKAIALEPDFAPAYAGLADTWLVLGFFELAPPDEAFQNAKTYAKRGLELDDSLEEGHVALGRIMRMYDWQFEAAEMELKQATDLSPNLAAAHAYRAQGLATLGRIDEALAEATRALELDPFSAMTCQITGTVYLYNEHYDEAIEVYKRALELDPSLAFALDNLGLSYVQKGLFETGISLILKSLEIEGSNPLVLNDLAYSYGRAGKPEEASKILARLMEMRSKGNGFAPAIAGVYATLGEYDLAFEWLEKAFEEHSPYLASMRHDFVFDPISSDPRFENLVHRIGL
jgi:TolB-like protein/Flp pilus assembly protein TadD